MNVGYLGLVINEMIDVLDFKNIIEILMFNYLYVHKNNKKNSLLVLFPFDNFVLVNEILYELCLILYVMLVMGV